MARQRVPREHRQKNLLGLNGDPRYNGTPKAVDPTLDKRVGVTVLRFYLEYELRPSGTNP